MFQFAILAYFAVLGRSPPPIHMTCTASSGPHAREQPRCSSTPTLSEPSARPSASRPQRPVQNLPPHETRALARERQPGAAPTESYELQLIPDLDAPERHKPREERRERKRREKLERLLEEAEMKFSHSIQFNAVPEWSSHYIAYSNLKKL